MSEKKRKESKENKHKEESQKKEREEVKEIKKEIEKVEKEIEEEVEEESQKIINNIWFVGILFLVIGVLLGLLIGVATKNDTGTNQNVDKNEVAKVAENTLKDFYYKAAMAQWTPVDIKIKTKDIRDMGSLYNVTLELSINGNKQEIPIYVTKDLNYVIPFVIKSKKEFNEKEIKSKLKSLNEVKNKTKKPKVILAEMSNCPFGNQVEPLFKEIIDTFGDKIEFEPRYIIYRGKNPYGGNYITIENKSYWSLHGNYELELDMFELAVFKLYDAKKWAELVNKVNDKCLPNYSSDEKIEELLNCAKQVAQKLGVDIKTVENYLKENKEKMIEEQAQLTNDLGIIGSPTIIVNGQQYRGIRTANAIKDFICTAFENPPAECNQSLKEVKVQATGAKCGTN